MITRRTGVVNWGFELRKRIKTEYFDIGIKKRNTKWQTKWDMRKKHISNERKMKRKHCQIANKLEKPSKNHLYLPVCLYVRVCTAYRVHITNIQMMFWIRFLFLRGLFFSVHYFIHLCFYNFMIAKTYNEYHTIERSAQHINHFNRCHEDGWISKCCNCVSYWIKRKRKINS